MSEKKVYNKNNLVEIVYLFIKIKKIDQKMLRKSRMGNGKLANEIVCTLGNCSNPPVYLSRLVYAPKRD
jgi:hypothetical protein